MRRRTCLGALAGGALAGCRHEPPDGRLRVPLSSVSPGQRLVVEYQGEPVEVSRGAQETVARSLVCTHYGCRVEWRGESRRYECPCHQGTYDEAGRPIAGPPPRPLRRLSVEVRGDTLLVGER